MTTPCNMHINKLADEAAKGADTAGGKGVVFNTITISDGISMGTPGMRYSLPNSRIMVHQPSGGFQGQATDIEIHAKEILLVREKLNKILARHTGQDLERIGQDTDRDNFMDPQQALDYGLVDKVFENRGVDVKGSKR